MSQNKNAICSFKIWYETRLHFTNICLLSFQLLLTLLTIFRVQSVNFNPLLFPLSTTSCPFLSQFRIVLSLHPAGTILTIFWFPRSVIISITASPADFTISDTKPDSSAAFTYFLLLSDFLTVYLFIQWSTLQTAFAYKHTPFS